MLRRCTLELSSSGLSAWKLRETLSSKTHLIPRNAFASLSRPPQAGPKLSKPPQAPSGSPPGPVSPSSGSALPKVILGGIAVGAAVMVAREAGYIDFSLPGVKDARIKQDSVGNARAAEDARDDAGRSVEDASESNWAAVVDDQKQSLDEEPIGSINGVLEERSVEGELPGVQEDGRPDVSMGSESLESELVLGSEVSEKVDVESALPETELLSEQAEVEVPPSGSEVEIISHVDANVPEETVKDGAASGSITNEDSNGFGKEAPESLARSYLLEEEESPEIPSKEEIFAAVSTLLDKEVPAVDNEISRSRDEQEQGKIILDLIEAIHTAEKRQAESDFRIFEEEKRLLKEKYEKELRDARARELMYAEEAAMSDKELIKEKAKAAAAIKMVQEKADQNLKSELQRKEEEAEMQLSKARELAKAELNAVVASEKSAQMEKIAEANLHINALCMAFYARSEEARQNHSIHKLALGALALEEALSRGLPVRGEIEALHVSLVDVRSDPLIDLVLSSLPDETLNHGTDTKLQLTQKFDCLKGTLRHFSFIPPGGGGILTHVFARVGSFIKIRENNTSRDGIEAVISGVEKLLAEGKLSEAADLLEQGASGTEAEGAIENWVRQAKNRAIVEQAVSLIRSYATSISLA